MRKKKTLSVAHQAIQKQLSTLNQREIQISSFFFFLKIFKTVLTLRQELMKLLIEEYF